MLAKKGWPATAKLKPLSLFISLLLMLKKAFDNVRIRKGKVKVDDNLTIFSRFYLEASSAQSPWNIAHRNIKLFIVIFTYKL